jgi:hypothetical protein
MFYRHLDWLLLADTVEKVENLSLLKISPVSTLGLLVRCKSSQPNYDEPWSILRDATRYLTSLCVWLASEARKILPDAQNDFFNTIGAKRPVASED